MTIQPVLRHFHKPVLTGSFASSPPNRLMRFRGEVPFSAEGLSLKDLHELENTELIYRFEELIRRGDTAGFTALYEEMLQSWQKRVGGSTRFQGHRMTDFIGGMAVVVGRFDMLRVMLDRTKHQASRDVLFWHCLLVVARRGHFGKAKTLLQDWIPSEDRWRALRYVIQAIAKAGGAKKGNDRTLAFLLSQVDKTHSQAAFDHAFAFSVFGGHQDRVQRYLSRPPSQAAMGFSVVICHIYPQSLPLCSLILPYLLHPATAIRFDGSEEPLAEDLNRETVLDAFLQDANVSGLAALIQRFPTLPTGLVPSDDQFVSPLLRLLHIYQAKPVLSKKSSEDKVLDCVRLLVGHGASLTAADGQRKRPVDWAAELGLWKVAGYLREEGAKGLGFS